MGTVLAISSQVVRGHVGNSAATFTLQRLGHEVWGLPTVLASNHLGYARVRGEYIPADLLREMLEAITANGWLKEIDCVLTGYLPSASHVAFAAEAIAQVKEARSKALALCDPVLGDLPGGLYVDESAAEAFREKLLPHADVITPNLFELGWLAGTEAKDLTKAVAAARTLDVPAVIVTSVTAGAGRIANVLVSGGKAAIATVAKRKAVPNGTGDLFSALICAHLLEGKQAEAALGLAVAGVDAVLAQSEGADELRLIETQSAWASITASVVGPLA
jgi:pyridoxine kinase